MLRAWGPRSLFIMVTGFFLIAGCAPGLPLFVWAMRDFLESLVLIVLISIGVSFAIKCWTRDHRSRSSDGGDVTPRAEDLAKARYARRELRGRTI